MPVVRTDLFALYRNSIAITSWTRSIPHALSYSLGRPPPLREVLPSPTSSEDIGEHATLPPAGTPCFMGRKCPQRDIIIVKPAIVIMNVNRVMVLFEVYTNVHIDYVNKWMGRKMGPLSQYLVLDSWLTIAALTDCPHLVYIEKLLLVKKKHKKLPSDN